MIKAEELMIGDWVMSIHPAVPRPIKVTEVGGNDIGYKNGILHISFIEQIPITKEILEKNGFKQEDDDCYLWNENLERIIWFEDGYTVITSVKCDRVYEGHCYNIHELQHALRLCGITKNIEL